VLSSLTGKVFAKNYLWVEALLGAHFRGSVLFHSLQSYTENHFIGMSKDNVELTLIITWAELELPLVAFDPQSLVRAANPPL